MNARAWLVAVEDPSGEPMQLTNGDALGSGALRQQPGAAQEHAVFHEHRGAWSIAELADDTTVNAERGPWPRELFDGDEIVVGTKRLRFCLHDDAPDARALPIFHGVRRIGPWTLFGTIGDGLRYALGDDGAVRTATLAPHLLSFPGAPALVDGSLPRDPRVALGQVRIIEDCAGVALFALRRVLAERGERVDPSLAVASMLALARCHAGPAVPPPWDAWVTFDGRIPVVSAGTEVGPRQRRPWRNLIAGILAELLGESWNDLLGDADLRFASAHARDAVRAGPLREPLRAILDVGARDGDGDALVAALAALEREVGPPTPAFVAATVADVAPDDVARDRALREQAVTLGAPELARRFDAAPKGGR